MEYITIPQTDLNVSVFALGTWVFGGLNWGDTNEKILVSTVRAARDQGVNLIDTAPVYGYGKAEEIIGRAIKKERNRFIVATKCGLVGKGKQTRHDLTRKNILAEVEASLQRLQTDFIDLYQCHWPDPKTSLEETLSTLKDLQKQGKIRYFGVSNFGKALLEQSCAIASVSTYQGQYSLMERSIENEILPFLRERPIGLLTYGSLGGGFLTGKYSTIPQFKPSDARSFFYPFFKEEKSQKRLERMEFFQQYNRPLTQVALNWVRQQQGVTSVIVGCRTPEQAMQNMDAVNWKFSAEQLAEISAFSFSQMQKGSDV